MTGAPTPQSQGAAPAFDALAYVQRQAPLTDFEPNQRVAEAFRIVAHLQRQGLEPEDIDRLIREHLAADIEDAEFDQISDAAFSLSDSVHFPGAPVLEPEVRDLVEGALPGAGVALLEAASGAGKTFLLLLLAYCVATKRPFFGRTVHGSPGVIFIAAEGHRTIQPRWRALCQHMGADPDALPFVVVRFKSAAETPLQIDVARAGLLDCHTSAGLVILDTLPAAFPLADENSAGPATATMQILGEWAERARCLVIASRHTAKSGNSRGSTAWHATADDVWQIKGTVNEATGEMRSRRLMLVNARDHPLGFIGGFDIKGPDKPGRTAVAVEDAPGATATATVKPLAPAASLALACFRDLVPIEGETIAGRTSIRKAAVSREFRARWTGSRDRGNLYKSFAKGWAGAGLVELNPAGTAYLVATGDGVVSAHVV